MGALEIAQKLGTNKTLGKIRESGLKEQGVYSRPLAELLEENRERSSGSFLFLAGALNNEDTEHMYLGRLREEPLSVLEGLLAVAYVTEAEEIRLYLPEGEAGLAEELKEIIKEQGMDIQVRIGMVDTGKRSEGIVLHLETLYLLSQVLNDGYVPGVRLCLKKVSEEESRYSSPVFAPENAPLWRSFEGELSQRDISSVKAVWMGNRLYDNTIFQKTIGEISGFGNGVVTVFFQSCCMVREAEKILLRDMKAACGICTFCREGMNQLYTRLHEITSGKGDFEGLLVMKEIAGAMEYSTLCSMGQTGGTIFSDTFQQFFGEYEDHIKRKRCTAGSCKAFINVYIAPDHCVGCGDCIAACPQNCIEGLPGYIHMVEDIDCTKCGDCLKTCKAGAIVKTAERVPALPDRLTRIGRFKRY